MTNEKQNEVSENKEIPHEINSVSDLSQILQTLGEPEKGHTRFFRGHGDEDWKLLPSIYRETYLIENEDKIIKDALTYCPDDFLPSDTLFEKLVKLQHYGYSTRLLDLTINALVALYFAVCNVQHHNQNGELIILDIPSYQIKYGDSDTVSVISAISLQNKWFDLLKIMNDMYESGMPEIFDKITERTQRATKMKETALLALKEQKNRTFDLLIEYCDRISINEARELIKLSFNTQEEIEALLHTIRIDKPSFRPVINPSDFNRVLCVRAKLNNARISRQQGCFLLFGIGGNKTEAAVIPDEWQRLASNNQKILVKAESKADIMQELKSFGISKRTLFPELEAQATEIMNHYKPQKNN